MKNIAILGATGSIGRQTLDVINADREQLRVVALAAGRNVDQVVAQAQALAPDLELVAMADPEAAKAVAAALQPLGVEVLAGAEGVQAVATHPNADTVVAAVVGFAGLRPTLAAIEKGRTVILANKETLVAAGSLVMTAVRRCGATLLPADGEHNAIFQCLSGIARSELRRLWLTASGGPFLGWDEERLRHVSVAEAVAHPNWQMGAKISVDSATLMNKGLEVIEAMHLFDVPIDCIDVVIHPQSIVHGLVELTDGGVLAHLAPTDMRIPLAFCLSYPQRPVNAPGRLDISALGKLQFEKPDRTTFPALRLAEQAAAAGGTFPAVLNAANEVAVNAFLSEGIGFTAITEVVERTLAAHDPGAADTLEQVLAADAWAREFAVKTLAGVVR